MSDGLQEVCRDADVVMAYIETLPSGKMFEIARTRRGVMGLETVPGTEREIYAPAPGEQEPIELPTQSPVESPAELPTLLPA